MGLSPSNPIRVHCAPHISCCFRVTGNKKTEKIDDTDILQSQESSCLHRESKEVGKVRSETRLVGDTTNMDIT